MKLLFVGLLAAIAVVSVHADEVDSSSVAPTTSAQPASISPTTPSVNEVSSSSVATASADIASSTTSTSAKPETTTASVRPTAAKLETTTTAKSTPRPVTQAPKNAPRGTFRGAKKYTPGRELGNEVGAKTFETKADYGSKSYKFAYETEDGQKRDEQVDIEHMGTDEETLSVKGHYSFVAADGYEYVFSYIADERGFRPVITVRKTSES